MGTTVVFLRFMVTIPVAATGITRAGARRPHMVGVLVEWGTRREMEVIARGC